MTVIGSAFVSIRPESADFAKDAQRQIGPAADDIGREFSRRLTSVVVGLGIGRALLGSLGEADEAKKALAQTEAVIKSTGGAAHVTAEQVAALSDRLSDQIAVDDDLIQASANIVATFTRVRNEVGAGNDIFNRTVASAQDMAAALGTDASGAALQLGKALNDPIRGLTLLQRAGVAFTAEQKEQIKALVQSGDLLSAQKIILDEVATEFAGSAAAQATALDRIKLSGEQLSEQIGGALEPGLKITAAAASGLVTALEHVPAPIQAIIVGLGGIVAVARPINETIALVRTLSAAQATTSATTATATGIQAAHVAAVEADTVAVTGLTAAQARGAVVLGADAAATEADTAAKVANAAASGKQGVALGALSKGLGVAAAAFVGITVATQGLKNAQEEGKRIAEGFTAELLDSQGFEELNAKFLELVRQRNQALGEATTFDVNPFKFDSNSDLRATINELDPVIDKFTGLREVIEDVARAQGTGLDDATVVTLRNFDAVQAALDDGYTPAVAAARVVTDEQARANEEAAATLGDWQGALNDAISDVNDYVSKLHDARDAIADLGHEQRRQVDAGIALREGFRNLAAVGERVNEQHLVGQERLDAFARAISSSVADVEAYTQSLLDQGVSATEAARQEQALFDQLFATADQAGLTAEQVTFLRGELGLLPDQVSIELQTNLAIELERAHALRDALADLGSQGTVDVTQGRGVHAAGLAAGPVFPGQSTLVNESGKEIFIPNVGGSILGSDRVGGLASKDDVRSILAVVAQLAQAMRANPTGGGVVAHIDARGLSPEQASRVVADDLLWRMTG